MKKERARKEAEIEAREEAEYWGSFGLDVDYTMFLQKKCLNGVSRFVPVCMIGHHGGCPMM